MKRASFILCLACSVLALPLMAETITLGASANPADPTLQPIVKLVTAAFKEVGYELVIKEMSGERSLQDANSGATDGDLARNQGAISASAYPNLVMVPEPLFTVSMNAYSVRKLSIASIDDLAKQNLSVVSPTGAKWAELNVQPKLASGKFSEVPDFEQAFKMLMAGRVDVLLMADAQARPFLALPAYSSVSNAFTFLTAPTNMYLNKKWTSIVPKLSDAIKKYKK